MRGSFEAGSLEEQDAARNKVGKDVDKKAKRVIIVGFFGAKRWASARTARKEKS